jgi:hypothetical protein
LKDQNFEVQDRDRLAMALIACVFFAHRRGALDEVFWKAWFEAVSDPGAPEFATSAIRACA